LKRTRALRDELKIKQRARVERIERTEHIFNALMHPDDLLRLKKANYGKWYVPAAEYNRKLKKLEEVLR